MDNQPVECEYLLENSVCKSINEEPEAKAVRAEFCTQKSKNTCCYLCTKSKKCDISCTYLETPKSKKNLETQASDDGPIILGENNVTLTKSCFKFYDEVYKISDMISSSMVKDGWKAPALLISFKDGTDKEFDVWTIEKESHINLFFSGGVIDTLTKDQRTSTKQWVTMINLLIALQNK